MWRNNGNGTFADVTESTGLRWLFRQRWSNRIDYNNDRAVDLVIAGTGTQISERTEGTALFENPREGKFRVFDPPLAFVGGSSGVAVLDFDHDGWMDLAFTHVGHPAISLWRNNHGKFEQVPLPADELGSRFWRGRIRLRRRRLG